MNVPTLTLETTLGDQAAVAIQKFFDKILSHETEVLKDEDPEQLHQMRVGMRRLRSAVIGFASVVDLPKEAGDKKIGKIARCLGTLRDLDVLFDALKNRYQPNLPSKEQSKLDKALEHLLKQRSRAFKEVQEILAHSSYDKLKQGLQGWLEEPKYQAIARLPILDALPDLLLPQIAELFLHPGWLVGVEHLTWEGNGNGNSSTVNIGDGASITNQKSSAFLLNKSEEEIVHDLRKQVKRVRYLMNLFTDFYGETYKAYLQDMKAIQEDLGDLQDSAVLEDFLKTVYASKLKKVLPTLAEQLSKNRDRSWQKWQVLQRRYLNPQIRQGLHLAIVKPQGLVELETL